MKRIIWHWTAGTNRVSKVDRQHYHVILDGQGRAVAGALKPEANESTSDGQYVAHTRGTNTGAIGLAVAAMAGARERPFNPGKYPITQAQLVALIRETADLCETYGITPSRQTVLSHAEVQPTLGIRQRGKWDITWIPGMTAPGDPIEVGDKLRAMVGVELGRHKAPPSRPMARFGGLAAFLKRIFGGK